jgi:ABC-type molybdate transport system substrate-binding protein
VLAGLAGRTPAPANAAALARLVAGSTVAVTDNTTASALDGRAVLAANQLRAGKVIGTANTGDAAFLVTTDVADIALIYRTDAASDPRLSVLATLAADPALTRYAAAVNAKAISPNARAVLGLIGSSRGMALLRQAGLETLS